MLELKDNIDIKQLIYDIRGKKVMLDSDVAYLFGYEVKQLNRQVNRNINRFPESYCFKLTSEEIKYLWCQNGTAKLNSKRRNLPYAFTEYGITMLAGLLKSEVAVKASIKIVNEFVEMKRLLYKNNNVYLVKDIYEMKNKLLEHDEMILEIFSKFDKKEDFKNKIFYDGEVYDAYSFLVDIIKLAKNNVIVIDNYVDKVTLDILSKKNINVTIILITDDKKSKLTTTEIKKFNKEYSSLKIKYTNKFHDRFILIDEENLYHLGTSIKDLGNKIFAINKIEDKEIIEKIINKVKV